MRRSLTYLWLSLCVTACAASPALELAEDGAPEGVSVDHKQDVDAETEADPPEDDERPDAAIAATANGRDAALPSHADALTSADVPGSAPRDAGRDAMVSTTGTGVSVPRAGACTTAAQCTKSCFPVGVASCCRPDHVCGCTWAPGAYCQ